MKLPDENTDDFESLATHEFDMMEYIGKSSPNYGWSWPGELKPMWGRRGQDSPHFGKKRPKEYCKQLSRLIESSWKGDTTRRKAQATRMKEMWKDGRVTAEQSRENGSHQLIGKLNPNVREIEYQGALYYGWRELQEATGVTKYLYTRYYLNGEDPSLRIGACGP